MRAPKPAVTFIFVTLLIDVLGFGLLIPVAPRLIQEITGWDDARATPVVGWLMATYAAMQFLFAPALGMLSDRFGRRPVLLAALFGSGLDYFAMSMATSLPFLFITRVINGISGASVTVASAYVADVTPPEKRAAGFGMIGAAFGLGFVIGPLMGGILGEIDLRYPFYAAGALSLCNWLYGYFVLPESLPPERRGRFTLARANPLSAFGGLARYPLVAGLASSFFFSFLAQFGLHATWVLYTKHKFGWGARDVGWSLFAVGVGAALVQGGLARKIIPWLGERTSVLVGMAMTILAFILYGATPANMAWLMYAGVLFHSLAGIGQPAAQALITKSVRPDEQGAVQGAITAVQGIANIIGPVLGAWIFAYFISGKGPYIPGAAFYSGAILCTVAWLLAALALRRVSPASPSPSIVEARTSP